MKGFYRRGAALLAMEQWEPSLEAFKKAAALEPQNADVAARVKEAEAEVKKAKAAKRSGGGYEADKVSHLLRSAC
jgi:hypothetical protein